MGDLAGEDSFSAIDEGERRLTSGLGWRGADAALAERSPLKFPLLPGTLPSRRVPGVTGHRNPPGT